MSVKLTIMQQMEQVAREHGKILPPLKEDLVLANCGLDSPGFAVLLARLEDTLGPDPCAPAPLGFALLVAGLEDTLGIGHFAAAAQAIFPIPFGDFVKVYEHGRQST